MVVDYGRKNKGITHSPTMLGKIISSHALDAVRLIRRHRIDDSTKSYPL